MRVRTAFTLIVGGVLGAGVMYLLDPDHGDERRREARRDAVRRTREQARRLASEGRQLGEELKAAAVSGYREGQRNGDAAH